MNLFEPTVTEYQVLARGKVIAKQLELQSHLLGSFDDSVDVEELVDDRWMFLALSDHKEDTHHESDLVPEERCAFDHALVYREVRALRVLMDQYCPVEEDSPHIGWVFVVFILEHAFIFLAEVPKVM